MITISIITVCYNSEATIEETLRSVISQDYPFIEYIVVDGGSTDHTLQIIEKYRDKIHTLISEPDEGMYDAMNKGIHAATGDVVGLIHANDLYAHEKVISRIAQVFLDKNTDATYGDLIYFSDSAPNKIVRYWRSRPFKLGLFAKGWSPAHPTFYVRRQLYKKYGVFDTTYTMGNDVELMMRFLEKYRITSTYIPELMVKMRLGGASNSKIKNILEQNRNILRAAKNLDIPISPVNFFVIKFFDRLKQFILKPIHCA